MSRGIDDMLRREGRQRAALFKQYPLQHGGVERWAKERAAKRLEWEQHNEEKKARRKEREIRDKAELSFVRVLTRT